MALDTNLLMPNIHELMSAYSLDDFLGVPGLLLWCVVVSFPLTGIDRRDTCTGFTYVLFCMAAGVVLLMALPMRLINHMNSVMQFLTLIGLGTVAGLRWAWAALFKKSQQVKAKAKAASARLDEATKSGVQP